MKLIKQTITLLVLLFSIDAYAEKIDTIAIVAYINQYKDIAISEMKRSGIPASITLAQGIHESSYGTSYLATNTNNHFGIKCKDTWTGKTFKYTDDAPNECFRVYDKVEDSYKDHSDFLKYRPRYASLFLLEKNDYKGWSYGLKKAGYATNPKYAEVLIKTVEDFQLFEFDKGLVPSFINSKPIIIEKVDDEEIYNVTDSMQVDAQKTFVKEVLSVKKEINTLVKTIPTKTLVTTKKVNKTIFKVNNCKAVKIYKGETLDLIGNVLKIEKEDLLMFNDINDETMIKDGQTIFIQQKKKSNKEGTYKVKKEDNLWSISQKKGVRLASLIKMNKLEILDEPAAKEIIYLKGKSKTKPELRANTTSIVVSKPEIKNVKISETNTTIIRAKDTIYPIMQETTKISVDSNKTLDWENSTKLLQKPTLVAYSPIEETLDVKPTVTTQIVEKEIPTVYPKVIDYNNLPKSKLSTHTVIKGDTMYNISKRYTISIPQIIEWNNLSDQSIKLGQVLKIQP